MSKKIFVVVALGLVLSTASVFADHPGGFGIGVQGGFDFAGGLGGAGLTLKLPSTPVYWTVDANLIGGFGVGVSGDYYFIDNDFIPNLGWYLGAGAYANLYLGDDDLGLGAGARVPVGLSWRPIDLLEIYLQAVPSIGVSILPSIGLDWGIGGNLGIRLWL